jgi:hypothetical protein
MAGSGLNPEQELAKTVQSRKGIQTSPDGEWDQQWPILDLPLTCP